MDFYKHEFGIFSHGLQLIVFTYKHGNEYHGEFYSNLNSHLSDVGAKLICVICFLCLINVVCVTVCFLACSEIF